MTEESKVQALPHNLIMENRNRLTVSGVSDVESFDEQTVVIFTQMGELHDKVIGHYLNIKHYQ